MDDQLVDHDDLVDEDPDDGTGYPVTPDLAPADAGDHPDYDQDPDAGDPTAGVIATDPDEEDDQ